VTDFRELCEASAAVRTARAAWRQRVHDDPAVLGDILATKPAELEGVLLVDLVLWLPGFGESKLKRLGQHAITGTRQVNLLVTLGDASERTRHWLASELRQLGDFYRPLSMELAA
jgi:hypothetical protein